MLTGTINRNKTVFTIVDKRVVCGKITSRYKKDGVTMYGILVGKSSRLLREPVDLFKDATDAFDNLNTFNGLVKMFNIKA